MNKESKSKKNSKSFAHDQGLRRKFFGNVEYKENKQGRVVEIKANNGHFRISRNSFLP